MKANYDSYMCRGSLGKYRFDMNPIFINPTCEHQEKIKYYHMQRCFSDVQLAKTKLLRLDALDCYLAAESRELKSFPMNFWPMTYISLPKLERILQQRIDICDERERLRKEIQDKSAHLEFPYK